MPLASKERVGGGLPIASRFGRNRSQSVAIGRDSACRVWRFGRDLACRVWRFGRDLACWVCRFGRNRSQSVAIGRDSACRVWRFGRDLACFGRNRSQSVAIRRADTEAYAEDKTQKSPIHSAKGIGLRVSLCFG